LKNVEKVVRKFCKEYTLHYIPVSQIYKKHKKVYKFFHWVYSNIKIDIKMDKYKVSILYDKIENELREYMKRANFSVIAICIHKFNEFYLVSFLRSSRFSGF